MSDRVCPASPGCVWVGGLLWLNGLGTRRAWGGSTERQVGELDFQPLLLPAGTTARRGWTGALQPAAPSRAGLYLLGQLSPPLLASLVTALQVTLVLGLESLHGHFEAQLSILGRGQFILQLRHLRPQVADCLFCHPAGSLQLMHLVGMGG